MIDGPLVSNGVKEEEWGDVCIESSRPRMFSDEIMSHDCPDVIVGRHGSSMVRLTWRPEGLLLRSSEVER